MGSATASPNTADAERLIALARRLGQAVAQRDCILVTGATTGFPDLVSRSARQAGGLTVGISPAQSREEHISRYSLPDDGVDVMIYTGFGLKGRNVVNVRSADIVIIFGGELGTLNEFTIAYDEGKIVGVVEGTGGAADRVKELAALSSRRGGDDIILASDPAELLDACLQALRERR
jgi:uncharacterized protein (TIGR00725 family)